MIGSDLEGADLESRVTSCAASATSDDATAVRAVIEAYGGRLAAADVAGVVSQFDDITVKGDPAAVGATSQGTITIRATSETQPARLRQLFVLERTGGHWKITQYMYKQMPEQSGGGCSGI